MYSIKFLKVRSDDTQLWCLWSLYLGGWGRLWIWDQNGLHKKVPGHPDSIDPICQKQTNKPESGIQCNKFLNNIAWIIQTMVIISMVKQIHFHLFFTAFLNLNIWLNDWTISLPSVGFSLKVADTSLLTMWFFITLPPALMNVHLNTLSKNSSSFITFHGFKSFAHQFYLDVWITVQKDGNLWFIKTWEKNTIWMERLLS